MLTLGIHPCTHNNKNYITGLQTYGICNKYNYFNTVSYKNILGKRTGASEYTRNIIPLCVYIKRVDKYSIFVYNIRQFMNIYMLPDCTCM
jgi:hypothetical protein